jgi:hypothetical protein
LIINIINGSKITIAEIFFQQTIRWWRWSPTRSQNYLRPELEIGIEEKGRSPQIRNPRL